MVVAFAVDDARGVGESRATQNVTRCLFLQIMGLIQHLAQLLHAVQKKISLSNDGLVLSVLGGWPIRLNDSVNLVDSTVQAPG